MQLDDVGKPQILLHLAFIDVVQCTVLLQVQE